MNFRSAVRDQITLLNEGKPLAAFDRYFDDLEPLNDDVDQCEGLARGGESPQW